jgi:hypothetical protein
MGAIHHKKTQEGQKAQSKKEVVSFVLSVLLVFFCGELLLVFAQTSWRASGEIASASQATINGSSAISGMTVFNNNRIRTDRQGAVIMNLGRLGRIEFGAETDMTVQFSTESIGGDLHSGRLVVSTRTGTAIAVNTSKGLVTSDGQQPAVLTMDVNSKHARIVAHLGEASLISSNKVERVAKGEALELSRDGWQRTRMPPPNSTQVSGNVARAVTATTSRSNSSLAGLLNSAINYSIDRVFYSYRDAEQFFDSTITCRDHDNIICTRWGGVTPK